MALRGATGSPLSLLPPCPWHQMLMWGPRGGWRRLQRPRTTSKLFLVLEVNLVQNMRNVLLLWFFCASRVTPPKPLMVRSPLTLSTTDSDASCPPPSRDPWSPAPIAQFGLPRQTRARHRLIQGTSSHFSECAQG